MLRIKDLAAYDARQGVSRLAVGTEVFFKTRVAPDGVCGLPGVGQGTGASCKAGGRGEDTWMGELGKVSGGSSAVWGQIQIPWMCVLGQSSEFGALWRNLLNALRLRS